MCCYCKQFGGISYAGGPDGIKITVSCSIYGNLERPLNCEDYKYKEQIQNEVK